MSFYKKTQGSTACLPSFRATIHTATQKTRYKHLKGLGVFAIDIGGQGDLAFDIPDAVWSAFIRGGREADEMMLDHFRKLQQKYEISWIRPLHNPNIAFLDNRTHDYRRITVAKFYIRVMGEVGYQLNSGILK